MGRGLARGLGVKLENDVPHVTQHNGTAGMDLDPYVERDPTPSEWVREVFPGGRQLVNYFYSLFPFLQWIGRYNRQYLAGDVIAGK